MNEKRKVPEYRRGKMSLTVWVKPDVVYQLKSIAVDSRRKQQDVIFEFLNDGFEKYNRPRIAGIT